MTRSSSPTATVRAFKTRLPNAFDMQPRSLYGKLSRLAFYGAPDRAALAGLLAELSDAVASQGLESLTWETVVFHAGEQTREIRLPLDGRGKKYATPGWHFLSPYASRIGWGSSEMSNALF